MDNNLNKKVSVNICTYNNAQFLPQAIDSVLNQNYKEIEIIIVDDCSTDNTSEILREYSEKNSRIKVHRNPQNLGINKSRNKALSLSTGDYIAVLDSDDYWIEKDKLVKQIGFLESNPKFAVVGTFAKIVDRDGSDISQIIGETNSEKIYQFMLMKNPIVHSSAMFRRSSLNSGYSEKYNIWEDYAAMLEIGLTSKITNLPFFGVSYRKHQKNISKKNKIKNVVTYQKIINNYRKKYPHFFLATIKNILRVLI